MNFYLPTRHRRHPMELQLTAMIDIFAMIVIFLIKGTVFGTTDVTIPENLKLAQSVSKESLEIAPNLIITAKEVKTNLSKIDLVSEDFTSGQTKLNMLKEELKAYTAQKKTNTLLNVIADRDVSYQKVFDVIRVFRETGFEVLLFVTTGPERST